MGLLNRITAVPGIFGGKPVIRGRRLAVEHVLEMLASGDDHETILGGYRWLEPEDIHACLLFGQLMERGEDWESDREWTQEVEGGLEGTISLYADAGGETDEEWAGDVEPDYDSEEDVYCRGWLSIWPKVAGDV